MIYIKGILEEHKKLQKWLESEDPEIRRMGFEGLFALDNRGFGLLVGGKGGFVSLIDWFKLVEKETEQ